MVIFFQKWTVHTKIFLVKEIFEGEFQSKNFRCERGLRTTYSTAAQG